MRLPLKDKIQNAINRSVVQAESRGGNNGNSCYIYCDYNNNGGPEKDGGALIVGGRRRSRKKKNKKNGQQKKRKNPTVSDIKKKLHISSDSRKGKVLC
ncbi:hypothetical protein PoB_007050100 [Plakobranchus ocellatus]|uniref:Uncharacterized protein n=1 Tax=Plakobranchus ocellatus TaxID=259542 RepID=A0AAV4DJF8_9GAST|nr:hypothetical protein PoB_007050100 [Plakobranchus ocellatus]